MLRQMERYYLSIGFPYFMFSKRIGLESHIKYIKNTTTTFASERT